MPTSTRARTATSVVATIAVLVLLLVGGAWLATATLPTTPVERVLDAAGTAELADGACVDWRVTGTVEGPSRAVPAWMVWEEAAGATDVDAALRYPQLSLDLHDVCGVPGGTWSRIETAWTVSRTCAEALATESENAVTCDGEPRRLIRGGGSTVQDGVGAIGFHATGERGEPLPIGRVVASETGEACFDVFVSMVLYRDNSSDVASFTVPACA